MRAVWVNAMAVWQAKAMAVMMEAVIVVTDAERAAAVLEVAVRAAAWVEQVRAAWVKMMAVRLTEAMAVPMEAKVLGERCREGGDGAGGGGEGGGVSADCEGDGGEGDGGAGG